MSVEKFDGKIRAFIKIQDGCNNFCSYCIIPYARGRVRSRKIENIIDEVKHIAKKGIKEVKIQCTMYQTAPKSADTMNVKNVTTVFCPCRP